MSELGASRSDNGEQQEDEKPRAQLGRTEALQIIGGPDQLSCRSCGALPANDSQTLRNWGSESILDVEWRANSYVASLRRIHSTSHASDGSFGTDRDVTTYACSMCGMYFEKEDETDYRHDLAINDWNVHFRRLSVWSAAARLSSLSLDVDLDALQRSGQNWQNALATIPPHATMSDGDRCYFRYCIEGVVDCHLFQESELGTPLKLLGHSNAAVRFDAAAHLLWIAEKRDPDPAGVRARHWIRTSIQRGEDLLRAVSEALVEPGQSFACSEDFVREPNPMARRALFLLGGYAQGQRGAWLPRTLLKREAARIELDLLREALPGLQGKLLALCRVLKTG